MLQNRMLTKTATARFLKLFCFVLFITTAIISEQLGYGIKTAEFPYGGFETLIKKFFDFFEVFGIIVKNL